MLKKRVKTVFILMLCLFLALGARLVFINVKNGDVYETMATRQQTKVRELKKIRGEICDRNGRVFTDEDDGQMCLTASGEIKKGTGGVYDFSVKKRTPKIARHLIGYTSEEGGVCGIEGIYDFPLSANETVSLSYTADAVSNPIGDFVLEETATKPLSSVRLTLDYDIQSAVEEVMDKYIPKGAVVVLDCSAFDVLAMASRPNFDGESIEKSLKSEDGELLNRALLSYNAGSVFKIITSAMAIENGIVSPSRSFDCRGSFDLGDGHIFACHKADGHGVIDFNEAFNSSCNCAYYLLGQEGGGRAITDTAYCFGMGQRLLNIGLWENSGNLPFRAEYSHAEELNLAIGQGEILITPLQCAVMSAIIANGGVAHEVNIVDELRYRDGKTVNLRKTASRRVIESETARMIAGMMRDCVLKGTASAISDSEVMIAGKTGSAESGWEKDGETMVHGWFCGFFPSDKPKYAMAVLAEGAGSGAESCVVPFAEIAEKIIANNL